MKDTGYKVAASCSAARAQAVKDQGADEIFDYKRPIPEQVKEILSITKGNLHRVFDAAATGDELARELFKDLKEPKLFSSTNTWYFLKHTLVNGVLLDLPALLKYNQEQSRRLRRRSDSVGEPGTHRHP